MRQLRFSWDDFALSPQLESAIAFPSVRLRFSNDLDLLRSEVAQAFPRQVDNFERLLASIVDYDDLKPEQFGQSARQAVAAIITDPLLVEMLFCPLMWYGNARENDMDFGQFCIMFRSIFVEGLSRPLAGVRLILKNLVKKFRSLGGELRLRSGVARIKVEDGRAVGVVLDNGEEIQARRILSSAGLVETLRMCDDITSVDDLKPGRMSFIESVSVLNRMPREIGHKQTIVFYNDHERFDWHTPTSELCDIRTGVICSPNNFAYGGDGERLPDGVIRVTTIADYDRWKGLSPQQYQLEKLRWYDRASASAVRFMPDFRPYVVETDVFSPTTIHRFTWHDNGAVYGAPEKRIDGTTHLQNLFLCGTDQGYVGIVGSIISGIAMANRHCLSQ
jgi:phytoene dehydrogenase-like protein